MAATAAIPPAVLPGDFFISWGDAVVGKVVDCVVPFVSIAEVDSDVDVIDTNVGVAVDVIEGVWEEVLKGVVETNVKVVFTGVDMEDWVAFVGPGVVVSNGLLVDARVVIATVVSIESEIKKVPLDIKTFEPLSFVWFK